MGTTLVGQLTALDSVSHLLRLPPQWAVATLAATHYPCDLFCRFRVRGSCSRRLPARGDRSASWLHGNVSEFRHSSLGYTQASSLSQFPQSLLTIEVYREAATMVMLVGVALLSASRTSARWAAFLWVFALWDIAYYAGLWVTVRWPASFTDLDVLFLIPVPWMAQVWFPLLVSLLTVLAIALSGSGPPANRPQGARPPGLVTHNATLRSSCRSCNPASL